MKSLDFRNCHPNLDMDRGFVLHVETEMNAGAVQAPGRHDDTDPSRDQQMAGAVARRARLSPRFASASAPRARRTEHDRNRHNRSALCLVGRQANFGFDGFRAFAGAVREKRTTHTSYQMSDRRKVDRDLISEAIVFQFQTHAG